MIIYKRLENTKQNIIKVEKLRYKVFGLNDFSMNDFEFKELEQCKKLIFAAFENDEIIAVAYVNDSFESLYIDNIFVNPTYKNKDSKIEVKLLNYISKNKELVEKHYDKKFDNSEIEYIDRETKSIYKEAGYDQENKSLGLLRKKI